MSDIQTIMNILNDPDLTAAAAVKKIKAITGMEVTERTVRKARRGRRPAMKRLGVTESEYE